MDISLTNRLRKTLHGILFVGMVFSSIGVRPPPVANAQESTSSSSFLKSISAADAQELGTQTPT